MPLTEGETIHSNTGSLLARGSLDSLKQQGEKKASQFDPEGHRTTETSTQQLSERFCIYNLQRIRE